MQSIAAMSISCRGAWPARLVFGIAVRRSLESGRLIGSDGNLLTHSYVVAGVERLRVALFSDEHQTYIADVVGLDPLTERFHQAEECASYLPSADFRRRSVRARRSSGPASRCSCSCRAMVCNSLSSYAAGRMDCTAVTEDISCIR